MFILTFSAQLIFLIAVSEMLQGIFLAALLYFHPRTDKSVNGFLSLYIICVCILLLIPAVQQLFSSEVIFYLMPFPLLIGPFLYLYVRSFKEGITWRKAWPHFVLFFIFLFLDYFFLPSMVNNQPQKEAEQTLLNPASDIRIIIRTIRNVQMIVYYFLAQRTLTSYQKSIHQLFSDISRIDFAWVRWLINGYLFLIASLLILFYFVVQYPDQFELLIVINTTVITPYIYLITFKGLTQPTLWQTAANGQRDKLEKEIRDAAEIEASKKDKKKNQLVKSQTDNRSEQIVSRIMEKMQNEKLFQETELTLQNLANSIGFPSYQVSQAINDRMNKNFYDLVNGCRVEEAKRLLLDPKNKNFTILSIGFEAGFNSKTTFNTIFKKFTGLTPTEFKDKQKQTFVSL